MRNTTEPIRQATQLAEIDPLDDPFGDAAESNRDSRRQGFRDPSRLFSTANQKDAAEALPAPEAAPAEPFRPEPLPPESLYNERDCSNELGNCKRLRDLYRSYGITSISLNITPAFRSSDDGGEDYGRQESKQEQLSRLDTREFHGADGRLLAAGHLTDYHNGHVYIKQTGGQLAKLSIDKLSEGDLCYVNSVWGLPAECLLGGGDYEIRNWTLSTFAWKASALGHKPLYFEERELERYGHTTGPLLQPWISGAHFFTNIALMPYKMGIHPPNECQYTLGYYRPGNCAPWLLPPIPLSVRGGLMQAGAVVGFAALIP